MDRNQTDPSSSGPESSHDADSEADSAGRARLSNLRLRGKVRQSTPSTRLADTKAAALLALGLAVFGFPMSVFWQTVTPRVEIMRTEQSWATVERDPAGFVLADLNFAAIGLVTGILAAIIAWNALSQFRGPIVLLGLMVGSFASQTVAWQFGSRYWDEFWEAVSAGEPGWVFFRPAHLRIVEVDFGAAWNSLIGGDFAAIAESLRFGVLATMALAAAFTYSMCAGWSRTASLRDE